MKITLLYMGGSRVQSGCTEESLELPAGSTLADAIQFVHIHHPTLTPLLTSARWACNFEFANDDTVLKEGDEVALLPPVAGGSGAHGNIVLTTKPLQTQIVVDAVAAAHVGATVLFVGTVRDHSRGKTVAYLDYEVYNEMAERQLANIALGCQKKYKCKMAIAHRYGKLSVGDVSIIIAAASPHRDAAFDATREALEKIKVDVPIWKREVASDGDQWVGWGGG